MDSEYRLVTSAGYVLVRDVEGVLGNRGAIVPEHRLVMSKFLGRPLESDELVHHVDRDKANNNIDNLMLVSHTQHASIHNKDERDDRPEPDPFAEAFVGRERWVKMRCPQCGKVFFKTRALSVLAIPNKLMLNCCSARCATLFADRAERESTLDLDTLRSKNIICEFRASGKFMREFVSRRHKYWHIDDNGVLHT